MKRLLVSVWAEYLKARRSMIFLITILASIFIPVMIGLIMLVIKYPELATKARMLAIKASMLGKANWSVYFDNLLMIYSAVGLILFGFIASWVFGREYTDRTVKDLLALPLPRSSVVLSKFIIVAGWSIILSFIIFVFWLVMGFVVSLDGWSGDIILRGLGKMTACIILTILLTTPVAFFASFGRSFLPPLGLIFLILAIIQIANFGGYTPYIPWAIPMLISGAAGSGSTRLEVVSYIILFATIIAGYFGTVAWWRYADQS